MPLEFQGLFLNLMGMGYRLEKNTRGGGAFYSVRNVWAQMFMFMFMLIKQIKPHLVSGTAMTFNSKPHCFSHQYTTEIDYYFPCANMHLNLRLSLSLGPSTWRPAGVGGPAAPSGGRPWDLTKMSAESGPDAEGMQEREV